MDIINYHGLEIRTIDNYGQTWYSVVDIVEILSNSRDPRSYWKTLKSRLKKEGSQLVTDCYQFKMKAKDGKMRMTDCLNRESVFRLIQSIPSPNAEPFKLWLASVGEQMMNEEENPELIYDRLIEHYRKEGRDDEWIRLRLRSILIRNDLTTTWKNRGVIGSEYAYLTDEIHRGTFDMSTGEHKAYKGLAKKDGLRDHLSNMELLFLGLGEEITRQLAERMDAHGFNENMDVAREGGQQAGGSRKRLEDKMGIKTITSKNYLDSNN